MEDKEIGKIKTLASDFQSSKSLRSTGDSSLVQSAASNFNGGNWIKAIQRAVLLAS